MTFQELRKKIGTQQEVADLLEVDRTTIAKWEMGIQAPRIKSLPRIAKLLGTDIETLALCFCK